MYILFDEGRVNQDPRVAPFGHRLRDHRHHEARRFLAGFGGAFDLEDVAGAEILDRDDGSQRLARGRGARSEEHTSELPSLMRISYAVLCLQTNKHKQPNNIKMNKNKMKSA